MSSFILQGKQQRILNSKSSIECGEGSSIHPTVIVSLREGARIRIGQNVTLKERVELDIAKGIVLGNDVVIEEGCRLVDYLEKDGCLKGAPIVIEDRVTLEKGVTVTAGVRIGQNSVVCAGSRASSTLPYNTVSEGDPARVTRSLEAHLDCSIERQRLKLAFYGHSLMHHREAFVPEILVQRDLPPVGSLVKVHSWVKRGYVYKLTQALKVLMPEINFEVFNEAIGGSNEYQILQTMHSHLPHAGPMDLIFIGCGLTGIWRRYTSRHQEALTIDEFDRAYRKIVEYAKEHSRQVVCVGEAFLTYSAIFEEEGLTPEEVEMMNLEGVEYMKRAQLIAEDLGCHYVPMYPVVRRAKDALEGWKTVEGERLDLWQEGDGAHYNDLGDTLLSQHLLNFLQESSLISALLTLVPR